MNIAKLKEAEQAFFDEYPDGFDSVEMKAMAEKHKLNKLTVFAHNGFNPFALQDIDSTSENMIKLVSRSSMVSVFEKLKFRDAIRELSLEQKEQLIEGLRNLLHEDEERGFNQILELFSQFKIAKWPLMTVFRCYYYPETDLLFKPTTVKSILQKYELTELVYRPMPSYAFFKGYRDAINTMKTLVSPLLSVENAAFSGFLMMTM